ncbi:hypothetical protein [Breoghania sp.]|uniref:hypothetical protein n=1 Tax=Breoghania sp. TaxID=2065378 RepID=UPI002611F4D5|nr:hypothetical protein [Breoghania sp.]MDJ0929745.1 hypothetical protein [Breoghania sp.]
MLVCLEMDEYRMTLSFPVPLADPSALPTLTAFFAFGAVLGAGYFSVLRVSARLFAGHSHLAAEGLTAARLIVLPSAPISSAGQAHCRF